MMGESSAFTTRKEIEVQTHSAPQNDRLNLSFVKGIKVVVKQMVRNGRKTAKTASEWRRFP